MAYMNRQALITLLSLLLFVLAPTVVHAQNSAVTITVDRKLNRHPISPDIYGTAYGDPSALADLNCPVNRLGGNNTSRYNWKINADNRGLDWYFQSVPYPSAVAGEAGDTLISQSKAAGAQAMLTIPLVGWVAKLGPNRQKLDSFSIAKYGQQTDRDWSWFPDAGNGILSSNGQYVTGNDPNDANIPADVTFQTGWVQHLISSWGTAAAGGLRYYILDNEPSIWFSTHRDIHPTGATMDEVRDKIISYSNAIKGLDSAALVVGPEEWGWSGYFYSGYDQQYGSLHGWGNYPDRANHGGWDYLPWLLNQLRLNDQSTGRRTLDVFSVHYYPQGGEFGNDVSTNMQLRRNRSTRSLWDPSYTDETWINAVVDLIPRLKGWVSSYYPATKIAITEYNWGAEGHINGATTQADLLGIFGREGLDIATRWTTPDPSSPTYKAIKIYRNYDGAKSAFGDTSVSALAPNPDNIAAFAAERSKDGALTIMVISKYLSGQTPIMVNLANFPKSAKARVWQLTAENIITRLPDIRFSAGGFGATVPSQSITLFVVKPAAGLGPLIELLLEY
jgi:hypothetical protein